MQMTSKERVMAAFEHVEPDRVPAWLGASPEFRDLTREHLGLEDDESLSLYLGDDFRRVFAAYAGTEEFGPFYNLQPGATYRTPFGVERHGYGYGMPLNRPLVNATTLDEVHAYAWPEILDMIRECNIRNYSIFYKDGLLFAHLEYVGDDFDADMAKMAADPKTQEWWDIMMPMQEPLETRAEGEWWANMEEVFHTD